MKRPHFRFRISCTDGIELMVQRTNCSGGNLKVLPPTFASMAPEGYYLLFVVQKRGPVRVPSPTGAFLKLTF